MSPDEPKVEQPPAPLTLKQFIDENQRLISVVGVFGALLLFSNQLTGNRFSGLIAFGLFTCLMALWVELHAQFPRDNSGIPKSGRLRFFEWGTLVTMTMVVGYWYLLFEEIFGLTALFWPIWSGLTFLLLRITMNRWFAQRLPTHRSWWPYAVTFVASLIGILFLMTTSHLYYKPVHDIMAGLRQIARGTPADSVRFEK